jgi:hypothetical protein
MNPTSKRKYNRAPKYVWKSNSDVKDFGERNLDRRRLAKWPNDNDIEMIGMFHNDKGRRDFARMTRKL